MPRENSTDLSCHRRSIRGDPVTAGSFYTFAPVERLNVVDVAGWLRFSIEISSEETNTGYKSALGKPHLEVVIDAADIWHISPGSSERW